MKSVFALLATAALVNAHPTMQSHMWANGGDQGKLNVRIHGVPSGSNPVTDVITCNVKTVEVPSGSQFTLEWDQHYQRTGEDPISGGHKGPVQVYISKAPSEAASFDGQGAVWTKIYSSGLVVNANGDKHSVQLPASLPAGEYLIRGEINALHVASTYSGAQFYIGCAQIKVTSGGSANPTKVAPGAFVALTREATPASPSSTSTSTSRARATLLLVPPSGLVELINSSV